MEHGGGGSLLIWGLASQGVGKERLWSWEWHRVLLSVGDFFCTFRELGGLAVLLYEHELSRPARGSDLGLGLGGVFLILTIERLREQKVKAKELFFSSTCFSYAGF